MSQLRTAYFLLLVVTLGLASCKNSSEHRVGSEFTVYVQRFQDEATKHGKNLDIVNGGLIVEFADLKDGVAGLCHYEKPIRIEIDRTYWDAINKYADADLMKEDLLFHELGHGFLGRKHLNSILENGDWKSIMCGGDKVNNRSWNINYHGVRRAYYLNELFNESTSSPDYSSLQFLADTTGFSQFSSLNFDSPAQAGWSIATTSDYSITLVNGRLQFKSNSSLAYLVTRSEVMGINSNFSYELTIENPSGSVDDQYGILFGQIPNGSTGGNDPIEYLSINNNKKMYMGNRSYYSFFTELDESKILPTGKNKLKIFKIGTMIYYFINNTYTYCSEIVTTADLNKFGFVVPPFGTVLIDNFLISQVKSTAVSSKVIENQSVEFEITPVSPVNKNSVLNQ
ncbi:MAG TPA: hypothetical protein VFC36_04270 [Paludibacter sp.]|nr:hypothetical protein [Paludibacter sp.]